MAATLLIEDLTDARLEWVEQRMKNPQFSRACFLGPRESLRDVIRDDDRILRDLGVSHERIARRLSEICEEGLGFADEILRDWIKPAEPARRSGDRPLDRLKPVRSLHQRVRMLFDSEPLSVRLDGFRHMLEARSPLLLPSGFGFYYIAWRGWQHCPFGGRSPRSFETGCEAVAECDFLITNPRRRKWIVFSGLLPHLIEAHHFFEGYGTPYRLDPALAVRVLELRSIGADGP